MTNSAYVRTLLAQAGLDLVPPLIRKTLLEDSDFRKDYGFKIDFVLSFGDSGFSFRRSDLFDAVRKILGGALKAEVTDEDGRKWDLKDISGERESPGLLISHGEQRIIMPDFFVFSPDCVKRIRFFDVNASDNNLSSSVREAWRSILIERSLEDDEFDVFYRDFHDNPTERARFIRNEILEGRWCISSLVPPSIIYFERLVGTYDGSASVHDYATCSGRAHFHDLSAWRPYDGFLLSLLLSSHHSLAAEINVDQLKSDELVCALEFLEKQGDRISQLGAIEVCLRVLPSRPEIETILIRLIEQIRDDDVNGSASGFKILSALFVLVDGELSRSRLLSGLPPFYRRLAALSQASLIHRQIVNSDVDIDQFCEWIFTHFGWQYCLQSLVDMRTEPRWDPDLAVASQIKADFFGRIILAARKYEENLNGRKVFELILGPNPESIVSLCCFPDPYLPGPLEGAEETQNVLSAEISEWIETQLAAKEVKPLSFIALVNSALIFRIDKYHADLAAKTLEMANCRLTNIESRSQLLAILNGLATVAAVTRSHALAGELRIVVRRYMRDPEYALSIKEAMKICLVTASSHAELNEWVEFVGDWLTELAFGELKEDDGEVLYSYLRYLCHVVPELCVSCGRADAALMAYNASRHAA